MTGEAKSSKMSQDKPAAPPAPPAAPAPAAAVTVEVPQSTPPPYSKDLPNDLYRRLLPAALFLLTFVTVMTMLLMYMDTTALRAQQFRQNMTHNYELLRIAQDDRYLIAYIRQIHLRSGSRTFEPLDREPEDAATRERVRSVMDALGSKRNGTFVEVLVSGPRDAATAWLERARGWRGLVARADPRDFFAVKASAGVGVVTLHACLSPVPHPREVTYYESSWSPEGVSVSPPSSGFRSRVLCYPLYTVLLAGPAECDYLLLSTPAALATLPRLDIPVIEVQMADDATRNETTQLLKGKGYEVKLANEQSVMYVLNKN